MLNKFLKSLICSSISLPFKHNHSYECIRESTASLASQDILMNLCFLEVSEIVPVSIKWLSGGLYNYRLQTHLDGVIWI